MYWALLVLVANSVRNPLSPRFHGFLLASLTPFPSLYGASCPTQERIYLAPDQNER